MGEINHKNVYECREAEAAIFVAERAVQAAKDHVNKVRQTYREQCAKIAGVAIDVLEFSDVLCNAKGISRHVYHVRRPVQGGLPDNKCIFCGCDNFDCGY